MGSSKLQRCCRCQAAFCLLQNWLAVEPDMAGVSEAPKEMDLIYIFFFSFPAILTGLFLCPPPKPNPAFFVPPLEGGARDWAV